MTKTRATTNPEEHGWYCCWLRQCERPVVLWWGSAQQWRHGMQLMPVTHWAGPL